MADIERIPQHVGFIMDGNRRWAAQHGLKTIEGHRAGMRALPAIIEHAARKYHIKDATVWAFSTENKRRPEEQILDLFAVFDEGLSGNIVEDMLAGGVNIDVIGDLTFFPGGITRKIEMLRKRAAGNDKINLTVALNYGGTDELVAAYNTMIEAGVTKIDREMLRRHVFKPSQPDIDLVIRTGGEIRTSGFMPIKAEYAEWYFDQTLWPDFTPAHFDAAIEEYQRRKRNFGK